MITSHHSFSTRIFLDQTPAAHAGPATTVAANGDQPENLREFWWFLRSGRGQVPVRSTERAQPGATAFPHGEKHA